MKEKVEQMEQQQVRECGTRLAIGDEQADAADEEGRDWTEVRLSVGCDGQTKERDASAGPEHRAVLEEQRAEETVDAGDAGLRDGLPSRGRRV